VDDVSADKRTSISVDCRTLDANDPAAIEARADNDDYEDDATAPPQPPPSPLVPPPASADLDVRSRDAAAGNVRTSSADDERGRRQEAGSDEMDFDPVMRDDVDLWARTTVKPASDSVEDADSDCE